MTFIGSLACVSYHEVLHQFQVVVFDGILMLSKGFSHGFLMVSLKVPPTNPKNLGCLPQFGAFSGCQNLKRSRKLEDFKAWFLDSKAWFLVHTAVWPGYSITLPPLP